MVKFPTGAGLVSLSGRLYRLVLLAYPPEFRRAYGSRMAQAFRDCCREAYRRRGLAGLLGLWLHTLLDLAATAPAERVLETAATRVTCILERGTAMRQPSAIDRLRTSCASGRYSATATMLTAAGVWSAFILVATIALRGTSRSDLALDFLQGSTPLYIVLLLAFTSPRRITSRTVRYGGAAVWGMVAVGIGSAAALQGTVARDLLKDFLVGGVVATVVLALLAGYTAWVKRANP